MEKRLIIAIALSLLVLLSWSTFVSKTQHIDNKGFIAKDLKMEQSPVKSEAPQARPVIPPVAVALEDKTTTFSTENLKVDFSESRAAIKEVVFKNYHSHRFPLKYSLALEDPHLIFTQQLAREQEISFVYRGQDREITKRFTFDNSKYTIDLEIGIRNTSASPLRTTLALVPVVLDFSGRANEASYQDLTVSAEEKILHPNPRKPDSWDKVKFLGWRERYFCGILEPPTASYRLTLEKLGAQESQTVLRSAELLLAPGEKISQKFRIYLGPQDLRLINLVNPEWGAVVHYGIFDFIARLLIQLLGLLYRLVHNWGLAIVLLSIVIYLILYPLTLKQMRSMKAMQTLQPRIEQLRGSYKDNPQRLNKEIMELYRENKVNPFGGCLPMILQIPVFFALYQVLMRSVALKGAPFLWIKDLSGPDKLFILSQKLPFLGNEINILPILMAIAMFGQQKLSSKTMSGASAEQQKLMLILFPIMFGFIFYRMPSGLVLYWFVNSSLMLSQQLLINRAK
jgi:YidC/Oxa1 family membrane protein insertase